MPVLVVFDVIKEIIHHVRSVHETTDIVPTDIGPSVQWTTAENDLIESNKSCDLTRVQGRTTAALRRPPVIHPRYGTFASGVDGEIVTETPLLLDPALCLEAFRVLGKQNQRLDSAAGIVDGDDWDFANQCLRFFQILVQTFGKTRNDAGA